MKTATHSITIKLGPKDVVTKPAAEEFVGLFTDLAGVVSTSRIPYRDASIRLGSALWQLRQQMPFGAWKRVVALADITEHRAQRCMKVAAELSRDGVIDMELVGRMREVARAKGCTLPFVMSDAELASFEEAHKLTQIGTHQTQPKRATAPSPTVQGSVRVGLPVPPVPSVATAIPEAAALGLTDEQYEAWMAEDDEADEASDTGHEALTLDRLVDPDTSKARPSGLRTQDPGRPLTGPQLPLAALYEHAGRVRARLADAMAAVESGRVSAEAFEAVMVDLIERLRVLTG
jgi:hypothetical protein